MSVHAQDRPPQILEVYRDYLKPNGVAANRKLENRAEQLCGKLGFAHAYLTIESMSGPAEMWYLNGFESEAEVAKLRREYQQNSRLASALNEIVQRKAALKRAESTDEFSYYRPDLSRGDPWIIGRGRFLVITFVRDDLPLDGTVFEMKDGSRMVVRSMETFAEARALARSAGSSARLFCSYYFFRPVARR